jgi:exodeoxyribonuclease VII large subunit
MDEHSLFDFSPHVLTISAINAYIRRRLEADPTLQDVWLVGEVSNWKQAASGHIYFTLKDAEAALRCVIWRSLAGQLLYLPRREGESVLAHGRISVYEAGGNYQFYVDNLEPAGQGALHAQFERIKARLAAEGLFEPELKQSLPPFPQRIGVVTSPDGAALRDILNVLRRRYPLAQVILSPTQVQGETAALQIIAALSALMPQQVDVIILARGGGSLEDLWAFNDERLARAMAACPIPIVTGIGHEIDFTIADFVADVRAPTPSAAAELVSPDKNELKQRLAGYQQDLAELAQQALTAARTELQHQQWALTRLSPASQLNNYRQRLDTLLSRATQTVRHQLTLQRQQVYSLASQLATLNPEATLKRGYAVVHRGQQVITTAGQVEPGDEVTVQVSQGEFDATVSRRMIS